MGCTIRHGPPSHRSLFGYNNQKRCFEVGEDRQTLFKVDRPVTLRVNPIFSSVLSQNSKLLVIAQLHPRSTEHLMSNIHLHNTIQHAFAALMQVQTSHLCMMILSRKSCTHHHHHQRRRQWIIFAVPTETKLGSTTFRFGSEHERKMSSIDPATEQCRPCVSRRSVILLMEDSLSLIHI